MTNLKFKPVINFPLLALIIFIAIPNQSCNNDLIGEEIVQKFAPDVETKMANIIAIVSKNSNSIKAIYEALKSTAANSKDVSLRNDDFDEVNQETENGLLEFEKDPDSVLRKIAGEAQGAEKIALIEGIFAIKDAQTLRKLYAPFGTMDDMPNYVANPSNEVQLRGCVLDCRLHWMAGASIAMGVSTIAYLALGRWSFWAKIAICAAGGVAAGIFAAHLREAYNDNHNPGSYSWRDFRNTMWGSFAGGAIAWGIMKLPLSRTVTWISMGVFTLVVGYCPTVTIISMGNSPGIC